MKFKPIRTPNELGEAKATLARLVGKNTAGTHDDDIEVLSVLIQQYEHSQIRIEAPTPIAAIQFRMKEMGFSPRHLEPFIGSRARVSEILTGKRSLSIDMIRSLHEGLGIPYASLISERTRSTKTEIEVSTPTIARLNSLGFDVDQQDLSSFVQSSLPQGIAPALHRKTRSQRAAVKTDQAALSVWQAAVLKKAQTENPKTTFDRKNLSADAIRRLAILSSTQRGPLKAIETLRDKGILTVIMPPLRGTFLDGAAMLDANGQPIIGLTLRHDRTDGFWFTLLHEVAHIHLHYEKLRSEQSTFVDDIQIQSDDVYERDADSLARTSLIPDSILSQVRWDGHSTSADITAVASRARVHPSIVAGRWQRDHQNYRKFSRLIERDVLAPLLAKA
jgi:HTH-type transcriptional regulator / antitoxin HigA